MSITTIMTTTLRRTARPGVPVHGLARWEDNDPTFRGASATTWIPLPTWHGALAYPLLTEDVA